MVCLEASRPYCLLTLPIALANMAVNEMVDNTSYHTFCARLSHLMHLLDRQISIELHFLWILSRW
jgi:hypothetical protein